MIKFYLLCFLILVEILDKGKVLGGSCNGKSFVCSSEVNNQFSVCIDDEPSTQKVKCPKGECYDICDTPCVSDINECPVPCDKTKRFTCINNKLGVSCDNSGKGIIHQCDANSICQTNCSEICTPLTESKNCSADKFTCTDIGKFPHSNDCKKYFLCITSKSQASARNCPDDTIFDKETGSCKIDGKCNITPPTKPKCNENGYYCFENQLYICPDSDSIPDVNDLDNIIDCKQAIGGAGVCDANCDVGCKLATYEDRCPIFPEPDCKELGTFPIINDCTRYYMCLESDKGFSKIYLNCPKGTRFDYETLKCSKNAICPPSEDGTPTITTETPSTPTPIIPPKCTAQGRIAMEKVDCKSYVECIRLLDGSYEGHVIECPGTSKFNPSTKKCTNTTFQCPN